MGLFIKHFDEAKATEFFLDFYKKQFSAKNKADTKALLKDIKENYHVLGHVSEEDFTDYINAASLAWMSIAWTKYYVSKRVPMMEWVAMETELEKKASKDIRGFQETNSLAATLSQAFGSSYTDGNTAMAEVFVSGLLDEKYDKAVASDPEGVRQSILGFSAIFVNNFDIFTKIISASRLVK